MQDLELRALVLKISGSELKVWGCHTAETLMRETQQQKWEPVPRLGLDAPYPKGPNTKYSCTYPKPVP